jgi:alcohol dehydrogenase
VWDYISGGTGKGLPLVNEPLPIVLITTTAGTGTEADAYGVVTNEETNEKIGFGGMDSLFPRFAIVDPELMITVPPLFTAYQGFDALFHSAEAYISRYASDYSDMFALAAIEAIAQNLEKAVRNGGDIEARERMAYANTLSGIVMTISVTTSHHSIEHALSAEHHDLPHGAGLIMISRSWFGFMAKSGLCDEKMINMAKVMGKADANKPADFVDVLTELQKSCGVGNLKMSDYGITKEELPRIASQAKITNPFLFTADPSTLADEDVAGILKDAWR